MRPIAVSGMYYAWHNDASSKERVARCMQSMAAVTLRASVPGGGLGGPRSIAERVALPVEIKTAPAFDAVVLPMHGSFGNAH